MAQAERGDEPCHLGRAARSKWGQGQDWRLTLLLALRAGPTAQGSAEVGSYVHGQGRPQEKLGSKACWYPQGPDRYNHRTTEWFG